MPRQRRMAGVSGAGQAAAPPENRVRRLAIVGVGLMGGSLALAAREAAAVQHIVAFDSDRSALDEALRMGAIDEAAAGVAAAAAGADLVVVATPVRSICEIVEQCVRTEPAPRLVSDMGSTKSAIMAGLSPHARALFIGGHPICGAANAGVRYSRADLFQGATYFLCTTGAALPDLYHMLQQFVVALGAQPMHIDSHAHDRIMANISHLPHVLANVLMQRVGSYRVQGRRALHWVGPSFKDMTRIAGANPPMWRDIFLENRAALASSVRAVADELRAFSDRLENGDEEALVHSIRSAADYHSELLQHEDLVPQDLYQVTVHIPDQPGVLSTVMTALGAASINIEDLTLHHVSRSAGGDLVLFVTGGETASNTAGIVTELGFRVAVEAIGDAGE